MSEEKATAPVNRAGQRKRFVIFGIVSAAALVLCTAAVIGVALSLITEGAYVFPKEDEGVVSLTPCPAEGADTVNFLDGLIRKATDDRTVYVDNDTSVHCENAAVTGGDGEDAMLYLFGCFTDSVKSMYPESYRGSFEDGFTGYPLIFFNEGEYTSAVCREGLTDEDGEPYDTENYHITLTAVSGSYPHTPGSNLYRSFRLSDDAQLIGKLRATASTFFNITSYEITPGEFTVDAVSGRADDKLSSVSFNREYHAVFNIEFTGDLTELGSRTFEFDYYVTEEFRYTWAGISFSESEINLSKGDTHELSVNAVMNDYSDYEIEFISSDEAVVSVDEMGYITGVSESAEPVTVTVLFTYLGNKYEASCSVTVTTPVEKITISADTLTLKTGGKAVLSAKLKPDNATVKDIIWLSEDESIATVDENGNVTAEGIGSVKIIAVSKDGFLRDSCEVTVTQ